MQFTTTVDPIRRALRILQPIANAASNSKHNKIVEVRAGEGVLTLRSCTSEMLVEIDIEATVAEPGVIQVFPGAITQMLSLLRASDTVKFDLTDTSTLTCINSGWPQISTAFAVTEYPSTNIIALPDITFTEYEKVAVNTPHFLRALRIASQKTDTKREGATTYIAIRNEEGDPEIQATDGFQAYFAKAPYITWPWQHTNILLLPRAIASAIGRLTTATSRIELSPNHLIAGPCAWHKQARIRFGERENRYPDTSFLKRELEKSTISFSVDTSHLIMAMRMIMAIRGQTVVLTTDDNGLLYATQSKAEITPPTRSQITIQGTCSPKQTIAMNPKFLLDMCLFNTNAVTTIEITTKTRPFRVKLSDTEAIICMPKLPGEAAS